jgi:hypothetical protein
MYVKCVLVGLISGTVAATLWVAACVFLPFWRIWLKGEGGLGAASISDVSIGLVWLMGFAVGFWLMLRR